MAELRIGVRELKTHLSEYLREVQKGKTIVITDHGKPVGRLIPAALALEDRIEALRRAGIITWSGNKPKPTTPVAARHGAGRSTGRGTGRDTGRNTGTVADLLIEDRE